MFLPFLILTFCINFTLQCVATQSTTATTTTTTTTTTTEATTANPCTTCTASLITLVSGNDADTPSTYTTSTDSDGCTTITYTCQGTPENSSDAVLFTFYSNSEDVGTTSGTGTISTTFTCVSGQWELDGITINELECQVAT